LTTSREENMSRTPDLRRLSATQRKLARETRLDVDRELALADLRMAAALLADSRERRDAILFRLCCQGFAVAELARVAGLSRQRAHQIVRARGRPEPPKPRPGKAKLKVA